MGDENSTKYQIRSTGTLACAVYDAKAQARVPVLRFSAIMNHFFLEAPEGFTPLDWEREIVIYKRNLPHWRQEGATYFVTFRLADSLPREAIRELQNLQEELEKGICGLK